MNSYEEFNKYYLTQMSEIGNKVYFEEQKEEDIDFVKEKEGNIVIDINNNKKEIRRKESTKRLKSYPKNYQTYTLKYKKYIIQIVNKLLLKLFIFLQVKSTNNDEEKVAKSFGIKLKTLRRWLAKGFKKYKGKYMNKYYFNIQGEEGKLGNLIWKNNYQNGLIDITTKKAIKLQLKSLKKKQYLFQKIQHLKHLKVGCKSLGKEII